MPALPTWLELLLEDVPAQELEQRRTRDGSDDEEAHRALLLHTRLRDQAQRAAGLAALSEMASRLASVRDVAELLADIARQARQLLRTDVAYLALVEDDALRIRYFDGVLGPAAPEIRLSLTAGLAGRVITTGRASFTTDYLSDRSIEHLPQADSFAGEEGLRSILGVPLHAAGRTLGVLFAAERSRRPFTDEETALLSGLAGHAAVALENARLLAAERTAAADLRDANDRLQAAASAVDRAVLLHDRLSDAVVRGGGPPEVVRALADVLKAAVQLVDAHDRPLTGSELGIASPRAQLGDDEPRAVVSSQGDVVLCPVVAADEYLGCLIVRPPAEIDDADLRLIERGALGIALALVQERAVADAAMRSRGELLTALVEGGEPDVLDRRAAAARIDLGRAHVLALCDTDSAAARRAAADIVRTHDGLVIDRAGRTLLLAPVPVDLTALSAASTVGVSGVVSGAAAMPSAYAEARRCLAAALVLGRRNVVVSAESLGVYRFLLSPGGADEAAEFVRRTVGPLLEHDEKRGTELARTLEEYLAGGRQHSTTAEALHIHANTLYQRLTRIGTVLGDDWRTPDRALDLHLALRLHRLAATLS